LWNDKPKNKAILLKKRIENQTGSFSVRQGGGKAPFLASFAGEALGRAAFGEQMPPLLQ
jgi:hypothetical protein